MRTILAATSVTLALGLTLCAGGAFAAPAAAAAPADGPISSGRDHTPPPPPAPGQKPSILQAPPNDGPDSWLPGQDDKRIHGEVGAGIDSRGGHSFWGSAYGPIGDNAWGGISVAQSKTRW